MTMRHSHTHAKRRTTLLSAVIAAALLTLAGGARAQAVDAEPAEPERAPATPPSTGPLTFVGGTKNAPYSFLDAEGLPAGYDVDVMNAIAERLRRSVTVKLMPLEQIDEAIVKGEADGVIGLGIARGRDDPRGAWSLCGPTVMREYRIAVTADTDWLGADATNRDLKGLRIAVGRNDPVMALFEVDRSVDIESTDSPSEAFANVYVQRVRAYVADQNTIQYAARQRNDDAFRMIGGSFYRVESYGPAVPIDGEGGLADTIRSIVASLANEGVLADLQTKWFEHEVNPRTYKRVIQIGAVSIGSAAVAALLVVVWLHMLRAGVANRTRKVNAELEVLRKQLSDLKSGARPLEAETAPETEAPAAEAATFSPEPTDLNKLIQAYAERLQKSVGRRFTLTLELAGDLPTALADEFRVQRMLLQLCSNARDAIDKQRQKHPDAPQEIWISTRRADSAEKPAGIAEGDFLAIAVRDSGCGIRQEMVQRIFHRGYTTKPNAAGRGLTYVYETIAEHGGWIDVESAVGRGAMFSIFLPVAAE